MSQIASDAKIQSAMTKLGMTAPLTNMDDSQVLKAILVALGNVQGGSPTDNPALAAALAAKADALISINAQTGTSYTLVLGDAGKLITLSNASAITLTVPPNADVSFEVGTQILLRQIGAGQVTINPGSGVTTQSYGSKLKLTGQYAGCTLIKEGTNTWSVQGNLSA